jgi:hypothetical protein
MIMIHHGNGVENALSDLCEGYTLVKPPYEDLKVDAVRELVLNLNTIWPHEEPALMAGPLDSILKADVLDTLLKSIEEPLSGAPHLILWAHDLGAVSSTIRSRCGEKYHYAPPVRHELYEDAERLLRAVQSISDRDIVVALRSMPRGKEGQFMRAYVEVIEEEELFHLYDTGVHALVSDHTSALQVYAYFMERV